MSEAFEIGVTLALSDGVSDGIARARKDIAQLEHVLRAGGVSVQQLRATAAIAVAATSATPVAEKSPAKARPSVERDGAVVAPPTVQPPVRLKPAEEVRSEPRQALAPSQAAPFSPGVVQDRPEDGKVVSGPVVMPIHVAAPDAMAIPATRVVASEAGVGGVMPAAVTMRAQAPVRLPVPAQPLQADVAPRQAEQAASAWIAPMAQVPLQAGPVLADRAETAPQRPWVDLRSAVPPVREADGRENRAGLRNKNSDDVAPEHARVTASLPASLERGPAAQPASGRAETPSSPSAPPAATTNAAPTEGDVFLDGVLVGRWISRFLTQEASRASAGPTGFDPRRGRLLPGATVGG